MSAWELLGAVWPWLLVIGLLAIAVALLVLLAYIVVEVVRAVLTSRKPEVNRDRDS